MLDRQDIDALLMGALYGELSPAESSRLEAHLSAHPQDRMVLDGLSRARQAVKDSLVLTLQAEPPAAVSALLMQEAARRAPAPREQRAGFFAKLVAAMRHPAFAAAAVIVLVAGVGGTLYFKTGDRNVAESTVATQSPEAPAADPAKAALTPAPGAPASGDDLGARDEATSGDGYTADLEGRLDVGGDLQQGKDTAEETKPASTEKTDDGRVGAKGKPRRDYVEVRTPEPQPKEPDDLAKKVERPAANNESGEGGAATTRKGATAKTTATVIVPADTPDTNAGLSLSLEQGGGKSAAGSAGGAGPAPGRSAAPEPPPSVGAADEDAVDGATKNEAQKETPDPYAAAKSQHRRLVSLVKANKCQDASKLAVLIAENYPDYYRQYITNDRRVKACKPYIENARKKNAEKAKRKTMDQPQEAPAPDSMKLTD